MKKIGSLLFPVLVIGAFGMISASAQDRRIAHPLNRAPKPSENLAYRDSGPIRAALTTGGTGAVSTLINHGGPVIGTPTIYLIWYGNWNQSNGSDTPAGQQLVRDWAQGIGGTPHFAVNTTYGSPISGNVSFGGETTDSGTSTRLSDTAIKNIVNNAISSNRLPYNANGVYFVLTSSNVTASSGFCTQYCGWHTSGNLTNGKVRYSFVGNAKRCITSCAAQSTSPNNNPGIDGAISVMTHELEEATTDPDLNAWYDSKGAENADKCAWTFGHFQSQASNGSWYNMVFGGHQWLIQRNLIRSGSNWLCVVDSSHN